MAAKNVINFPKCPNCGSEDTVGKDMLGECFVSGMIEPGSFLSLHQQVVRLNKPDAMGFIMILVIHRDACMICGIERITRVEKRRMNPISEPIRRTFPGPGFSPS